MTEQASLFPESQDDRIRRLDASILHLITGGAGGSLGFTLRDEDKAVLKCIRYHRGLKNAINISEIAAQTELNVRTIKGAVRTLRLNFRLPIASSKHGSDGGYYLIVTEEDRGAWVRQALEQIRGELAVLRAVAGHHAGLELLGQLHMELTEEKEAANA
jgi:hypothetical protein